MKLGTLLELGRVSNLPTVWSNVFCGGALAGAALDVPALVLASLAGSLFYVGGMLLNDAFDAEIDARERPERPIPSGRASRREVTLFGAGLLASGLLLLAAGAFAGLTPAGPWWPLAGLGTALAVVLYDRFHKGVAWSPIVMGACRAGLYLIGALALARAPSNFVLAAAGALLLYVVGLTHIARFETASAVGRLWPTAFLFTPLALALAQAEALAQRGTLLFALALASVGWTLRALRFARQGGKNIGTAVVSLIAGISLVDALFAAVAGSHAIVAVSLVAVGLTLAGQKKVRGT